MNTRAFATPILIAFCFFAAFWLYIPPTTHVGHETGCPFSPGGTVVCASPLTHLAHWQSAIVAVLLDLLLLIGLATILFIRRDLFGIHERHYGRYRQLSHVPVRPTLFQELFSQGILNRKEP